MEEALQLCPGANGDWNDYSGWLEDDRNIMAVDGKDTGLATYNYPGVYSVHWFFKSRGRDALNQARAMLDWLFQNSDAKAVRGLTKEHIKAARWLARQIGFTSYGIIEFADGPYELFCMTKEEFYNGRH